MWKDFWALSRIEQRGFLLVCTLLIVLIVLLFIPLRSKPNAMVAKVVDKAKLHGDSTEVTTLKDEPKYDITAEFNPNQVSIKELEKMGLGRNVIVNWKKYQEAGGRFDDKEDVLKIYKMDTLFYRAAVPFMVFDDTPAYKPVHYPKREKKVWVDLNRVSSGELLENGVLAAVCDSIMAIRNQLWFCKRVEVHDIAIQPGASVTAYFRDNLRERYKVAKKEDFVLELNSADTAQLVLLKGIGSVLARRIVQYRRKIGGYYSVDQLLQVYGMSADVVASAAKQLKIDQSLIVPLNINKASLRRMKDHPMLGYYKAQAIVDYRVERGVISELAEVMKLEPFRDDKPEIIGLYFSLQ